MGSTKMRKVKYRAYWGATDYFWRGRKNFLSEFVLDILYFIGDTGVVPPLAVLNEVLQEGGATGGMSPGTKWKPFAISEAEYIEMVEALLAMDIAAAKKKHPFVRVKRIVVDPEFDQITDYRTWIDRTYKKYYLSK